MAALPGTKADHAAKKTRSLGWLTESAMPRKRASRSIELQDGNSSAVQLKAALLQVRNRSRERYTQTHIFTHTYVENIQKCTNIE